MVWETDHYDDITFFFFLTLLFKVSYPLRTSEKYFWNVLLVIVDNEKV